MNERELFLIALDQPDAGARSRYLDEACAGDSVLRAKVDGLLSSHATNGNTGDFLEQPPPGIDGLALTIRTDDAEDFQNTLGDVRLDFLTPSSKPGCLGTLGKDAVYEVVGTVGRGAFGIVLRAYDTKLNRIVAIKVMAPELATNPMAVRRFLREAQAAAAVTHDHIVTIHAIHETDSPPFIVMEYVEGESLKEKVDRDGALELGEILRIGAQMAAGLAAAHGQGLVHRDIKPANILLENGIKRVKITDFGLARAVDDVGMTRTGMITGTPQYMSPEQGLGQPIDARSDLFSLGSVLYTLSTGRPPFRADSAIATLRRVCDDDPRAIREVNSEIPGWFAAIVMRLLEKKADDRYQSADEVATLLNSCVAHLQSGDASPPHAAKLPPRPLSHEVEAQKKYTYRRLPFVGLSAAHLIFFVSGMFAVAYDESAVIPICMGGIVMGGLVTFAAIVGRLGSFAVGFGLSSIVTTLVVIGVFDEVGLDRYDVAPIILVMACYAAIAVPWGLKAIWRALSLDPEVAKTLSPSVAERIPVAAMDAETTTPATEEKATPGAGLGQAIFVITALFHIVSIVGSCFGVYDDTSLAVPAAAYGIIMGVIVTLTAAWGGVGRRGIVFGLSSIVATLLIVACVVAFGIGANEVGIVVGMMASYTAIAVPLGFRAIWSVVGKPTIIAAEGFAAGTPSDSPFLAAIQAKFATNNHETDQSVWVRYWPVNAFVVLSIVQMVASVLAVLWAASDLDTCLLFGGVFGIGLGSAIAILAYVGRLGRSSIGFGVSSIVATVGISGIAQVFDWGNSDWHKVAMLMACYSVLAIVWGTKVVRKAWGQGARQVVANQKTTSATVFVLGSCIQLFVLFTGAATAFWSPTFFFCCVVVSFCLGVILVIAASVGRLGWSGIGFGLFAAAAPTLLAVFIDVVHADALAVVVCMLLIATVAAPLGVFVILQAAPRAHPWTRLSFFFTAPKVLISLLTIAILGVAVTPVAVGVEIESFGAVIPLFGFSLPVWLIIFVLLRKTRSRWTAVFALSTFGLAICVARYLAVVPNWWMVGELATAQRIVAVITTLGFVLVPIGLVAIVNELTLLRKGKQIPLRFNTRFAFAVTAFVALAVAVARPCLAFGVVPMVAGILFTGTIVALALVFGFSCYRQTEGAERRERVAMVVIAAVFAMSTFYAVVKFYDVTTDNGFIRIATPVDINIHFRRVNSNTGIGVQAGPSMGRVFPLSTGAFQVEVDEWQVPVGDPTQYDITPKEITMTRGAIVDLTVTPKPGLETEVAAEIDGSEEE